MKNYTELDESRKARLRSILHEAIVDTFTESDWSLLGHRIGFYEHIENHSTILQHCRWKNDQYGRVAMILLIKMLEANPDNLRAIWTYGSISKIVLDKHPTFEFEALLNIGVEEFKPSRVMAVESTLKALEDANTFIQNGNDRSALDRVYTAFHGYLRVLAKEDLDITDERLLTDAPALLKRVLENHPAFIYEESYESTILAVRRAMRDIGIALRPVRNEESLAHPNDFVLDKAEAGLYVDATKTLLRYLDTKLRLHQEKRKAVLEDDDVPF